MPAEPGRGRVGPVARLGAKIVGQMGGCLVRGVMQQRRAGKKFDQTRSEAMRRGQMHAFMVPPCHVGHRQPRHGSSQASQVIEGVGRDGMRAGCAGHARVTG